MSSYIVSDETIIAITEGFRKTTFNEKMDDKVRAKLFAAIFNLNSEMTAGRYRESDFYKMDDMEAFARIRRFYASDYIRHEFEDHEIIGCVRNWAYQVDVCNSVRSVGLFKNVRAIENALIDDHIKNGDWRVRHDEDWGVRISRKVEYFGRSGDYIGDDWETLELPWGLDWEDLRIGNECDSIAA